MGIKNIQFEVALRDVQRQADEVRKIAGLRGAGEKPEPPICSFCGLAKNQYEHCVAGPDVFICDECIELAQSIVDEKRTSK